jgi:hypothetical protein
MLDDIKLTKSERAAIERAYVTLYDYTRSDWELDHWTAQERKGYGHAGDRVPLICAKALIVKWFMQGVSNPHALLRDAYALRSAAVYMQGLGAHAAHQDRLSAGHLATLAAGRAAWAAAFDRMHQASMAALRAAQAAA